ncbi:histidine phosphatase family protein [Hydrogenophaga sp. OTU3427]|uniref:histidine phosphatase family protein n=1 Tax=Hydrogenophaga sp. OTU3427 TaxID=3043856 RepID=UPI00313AB20C
MKLWLLRHAQVLAAPGLCYGASDLPAHAGHTDAAARAAALCVPAGLPLWVSGLGRARQLADRLHALRPDLGPPRTDVRLNEMDFGRWEGQAWQAIPRAAFDDWLADFAHHRFGGAESTQQVIARVAAALADQRAAFGPGGEAVWVTHAGVIRAVAYLARHGPAPIAHAGQWPEEAPAPGGLVCVSVEG